MEDMADFIIESSAHISFGKFLSRYVILGMVVLIYPEFMTWLRKQNDPILPLRKA